METVVIVWRLDPHSRSAHPTVAAVARNETAAKHFIEQEMANKSYSPEPANYWLKMGFFQIETTQVIG